jgi:siroheme synthase (precorrin-2 oxidase/ferrochelatase)
VSERDVTEYPYVFFPVGLNLRDRLCVVIGDDAEAHEKAQSLHEVGARLRCIPDVATLRDEDLSEAFFVISTPQDAQLSARLRKLADERGFLLCCIDQPAFGFVAMQAIVKAGAARIAISTGGVAPGVGKRLKEALQRALDAKFVRFLECLNAQRERNRERFANAGDRRAAMITAADGFEAEVAVRYPPWFEESATLRPEIAEDPSDRA